MISVEIKDEFKKKMFIPDDFPGIEGSFFRIEHVKTDNVYETSKITIKLNEETEEDMLRVLEIAQDNRYVDFVKPDQMLILD